MTGGLRPAVRCCAQSRVHVHDEECAAQEAHGGRAGPKQFANEQVTVGNDGTGMVVSAT